MELLSPAWAVLGFVVKPVSDRLRRFSVLFAFHSHLDLCFRVFLEADCPSLIGYFAAKGGCIILLPLEWISFVHEKWTADENVEIQR